MLKCSDCKLTKDDNEFYDDRSRKNKKSCRCIECQKMRSREQADKQRLHPKYPIPRLLTDAKLRAKQENLPFDITVDDLEMPKLCPVLGTELRVNPNGRDDNSPSLDKLIPELGYIKGNVFIISWRANQIKRNGTALEHYLIAKWIEKNDPR